MNSEPQKAKEQKHVNFYGQINHLARQVRRLDTLVTKIEGGVNSISVDEKQPEQAAPSLIQFLDDEPGRITDLASNIDKIRERIETALF